MKSLLDRKPGYDARTFAEAQALIEDGLELDFVLGLYPDDAAWLAPMLGLSGALAATYTAEQPSYFFEASLKNRFLAAAREAAQPVTAAPTLPAAPAPAPFARVRTAFAGASVVASAAAVGILTLGFVTAGDAVPGDWNYTFKRANERLDYALSRGDDRVGVQLKQAQARVYEIQKLSSRGDLSEGDLARLEKEARSLADQAQAHEIDEVTKAELRSLDALTVAVLDAAAAHNPALEPAVATTKKTVSDAVAASVGETSEVTPVTPVASPTATPGPDATPTP
ncbi:MAG: hypothetical protein HY875_17415 [Chloroflexi bacterium]|nr:hypothetical protein [Chloroflexota bacterium]